MTRRPVRRPTAAVAAPLVVAFGVALALTLAGCSGDDSGGSAEEPAPSSVTTSTEPAPSPTDQASTPATSAAPTVAPATGLLLQQTHAAVNAPAGWTEGDAMAGYASSAYGPGNYDVLQLSDRPSLAGGATLDQLAESRLEGLPSGSEGERLPDVELGGEPAYVVRWTRPGQQVTNWDVATVRDGQSVAIGFVVSDRLLAEQPQLLESVLASFRWLDQTGG